MQKLVAGIPDSERRTIPAIQWPRLLAAVVLYHEEYVRQIGPGRRYDIRATTGIEYMLDSVTMPHGWGMIVNNLPSQPPQGKLWSLIAYLQLTKSLQ